MYSAGAPRWGCPPRSNAFPHVTSRRRSFGTRHRKDTPPIVTPVVFTHVLFDPSSVYRQPESRTTGTRGVFPGRGLRSWGAGLPAWRCSRGRSTSTGLDGGGEHVDPFSGAWSAEAPGAGDVSADPFGHDRMVIGDAAGRAPAVCARMASAAGVTSRGRASSVVRDLSG